MSAKVHIFSQNMENLKIFNLIFKFVLANTLAIYHAVSQIVSTKKLLNKKKSTEKKISGNFMIFYLFFGMKIGMNHEKKLRSLNLSLKTLKVK